MKLGDLTGVTVFSSQARIQAAKESGGGRPSVPEAHYQNVSKSMSALRSLGHVVTGAEHTDPKRMPTGMSRSVINHSSGKNKFRTIVRTGFNSEGGDHTVKQVTEPVEKPAPKAQDPSQEEPDTSEQQSGDEE